MGHRQKKRGQRASELERLRAENAALLQENLELRRENARLLKRIEALEKELARLREKLGINSQNSSMPPSSDRPDAPPRQPRRSSGRKPGGQPGHPRHERPLVPAEKLTDCQEHKPRECRVCHAVLLGEDPHPEILQQVEIPEPRPLVIQHEMHSLRCLCCGAVTTGALPPGVPRSPFGVRLQALVALYSSEYRLSDRKIQDVLRDIHSIVMSVGSVSDCRQKVSKVLAGPVEEARRYIREQFIKYADETGWKEGAKRMKAWLWLVCTQFVTVFLIQPRRNTESAQRLLGEIFGVLVTDRLGSYNWWPLRWRQLCWSHLKRDFQRFVDAGGAARKIGLALQEERRQLFAWWHRLKHGAISRATFRRYVAPLRKRVRGLLERGAACRHAKTAGSCKELLKVEPALWTFVRIEGVEPTNNTSERSGRPAVIKRKLSYGTHSPAGSRFIERMMTVITSLKQQSRPVLPYLVEAIQAKLEDRTVPSIVPPQTASPAALP